MTDQELIQVLRKCADLVQDSEWVGFRPALYWGLKSAADRIANQYTHIRALQKAIEDLRKQNEQLREAAAMVTKESAELLERRWIPVTERLPDLESWGTSGVVLGWIKPESTPSLNKLHNLTLCVYCDNGIWSMPGRYVSITHWMPLPEPPEVEK